MLSAPLEALRDLDRAHHIHPFTNHSEMHAPGTHVITRGEGCFVIGEDGERLLDGLAGLWCVNIGYNCREIINAINHQLEKLPYYPSFFNSTTEPPILVAEFLARCSPARLKHTFFAGSGSEANETALKVIRAYNLLRGRPEKVKILSREYAYHGVTLATSSLTGLPNCNKPFGLPFDTFLHAPSPHWYAANTQMSPEEYGQWAIKATAELIEREGAHTIAAMFVEPIQGAGGVIVPPQGYLPALRKLCRENDILFVADEVIAAFGRLGCWFASSMWDLDPDLMSLAKGLTSGYLPFGATMVCDEIVQTLHSAGYFSHGYTYSGHPTCAAAALANLDYIETRGLLSRVRDEVGPYFQQKLQEFEGHPAVGNIRGMGLIGALELLPRGGRDALDPSRPLGLKAAPLIRAEGVIVRGIRDIVAVAPPLIITREEIDQLFAGVRRGLDRLWD